MLATSQTGLTEHQIKWANERRERLARMNTKRVDQPVPVLPASPSVTVVPSLASTGPTVEVSALDPRLTFSTFKAGGANTLAYAAARQLVEASPHDPSMFNPLYVHAEVGLGKTHLLQAIAAECITRGNRRVLYLTAEKFMYSFVVALRDHRAAEFKAALRDIDLLLIDDLQYLQGKSTQLEFGHALVAAVDSGRQVVLAADRAPIDLEGFEERTRSRLTGGMVIEIGQIAGDVRLEILKARLDVIQRNRPDFIVPDEVLDYLATSITQNGRSLDAAINRLLAQNTMFGHSVTLEMADREIQDLIQPVEAKRIKIEDIQRVVSRHYNVSRADMISARRTANIVRPRQIAMYLAKTLTLRSLPEIGRRFGGRDHTTVLHAVRKMEGMALKDGALAAEFELLRRMCS